VSSPSAWNGFASHATWFVFAHARLRFLGLAQVKAPRQSIFRVPVVLLGPGPVSHRRDSGSSSGRSYSVLAGRFSLSSREPRSTARIYVFVLSPKGPALTLSVSSDLSSYAVLSSILCCAVRFSRLGSLQVVAGIALESPNQKGSSFPCSS
jgi:hypothetical protein